MIHYYGWNSGALDCGGSAAALKAVASHRSPKPSAFVFLCFFIAASASAAISSSERDALIALYNSTGGASWTQKSGWLGSAGTECTWRGVACNAAQTSVIGIALSGNNLTGPIPPQIGQLVNLVSIDLSINNIGGSIPREIQGLTKIEKLELWENQLSGPIPVEITSLTTLRVLDLYFNKLTGPIPIEIRALRNLEFLELGSNLLTGSIPKELAELTNLKYLALYLNKLTGPIPPELWRMSSLVEIWLPGNRLTGTIPPEVRNLVNLEVLVAWENELTGPIPVELTRLTKLRVLGVASNELTGSIPDQIGLLTRLETLDLSGNNFTGVVPETIRNLTQMKVFDLSGNDLSGTIPPWIGELTALTFLALQSNELTGPIPSSIGNLKALTYLSLGNQQITGPIPSSIGNLSNLALLNVGSSRVSGSIPPEIGNLKKLEFLSFQIAEVSGPLPAEIGELRELKYLFATFNEMTGAIPPAIWNLTKLITLSLSFNHFEGPLPPEIGNLVELETLGMKSNRFAGPVPREIGNLTKLEDLDLSYNALRGAIPREITKLTSLRDGFGLDLSDNLLYTDDPVVRDFIFRKDSGAEEFPGQTVTPRNVRVAGTTDRTATVEWERVPYWYAEGGIQITAATTPNGPPVVTVTTERSSATSIVVRNLAPDTMYHFRATTVTYPDFWQQNVLTSDPSPAVSATTGPRVLGPPQVEETESPRGLVQIDGVPQNEDRFALTNFGDRPTTINMDVQANFVTIEPRTFTLNPGATQMVVVKSLTRPIGTYSGYTTAAGEGANNYIWITLLSVAKPAGVARAEAVDSRVEVAGAPGSDSVGQARFRNVGSETLVGMLVSDQPWLVPETSRVFIGAGHVTGVNFRVVRARRPPGAEGALVANLTLVYVADPFASGFSGSGGAPAPPGVSATKVTVVDVSKPALSAATIPPAGDVAYFLPGVASFLRDGTSFVSDVSLLNHSGGRALGGVRLYYTAAASSQTSVATLSPIPGTNSVTLANVVSNVYGATSQVGSIQIRSDDWQSLVVQAKLLGLSETGTVAGDIPTFRSDRSIGREDLYLAGVRKSQTTRTNLYVQETSGFEASVSIAVLDQNGVAIGQSRTATVTPFGMVEIVDAVPQGGVTAVVTNSGSGRIAAYARVFDDSSGENWSVVDWSRFQDFKLGEAMRVPFVDGSESRPGGKRRAVTHATAPRAATDVTLFNPTSEVIGAAVQIRDSAGTMSERRITLAPRQTLTLANVGADAGTPTAQVVIAPIHEGKVVATARTSRSVGRTSGAGIPVVAASSGLRAGRSQIFSNIQDSTSATVASAAPGTYRTSFGLVEVGGASAVVRARIFLDEGRSLASSAIYRDFRLAPGQQIVVDELVRAIVGPSRDSALGDLHNLQLRIEVIDGRGSVVPFIITTDNATGDSILRLD